MNIQDAINILNEHNHREVNKWYLNEHGEVSNGCDDLAMEYFEPFEAIAIAQAYVTHNSLRESPLYPHLKRAGMIADDGLLTEADTASIRDILYGDMMPAKKMCPVCLEMHKTQNTGGFNMILCPQAETDKIYFMKTPNPDDFVRCGNCEQIISRNALNEHYGGSCVIRKRVEAMFGGDGSETIRVPCEVKDGEVHVPSLTLPSNPTHASDWEVFGPLHPHHKKMVEELMFGEVERDVWTCDAHAPGLEVPDIPVSDACPVCLLPCPTHK